MIYFFPCGFCLSSGTRTRVSNLGRNYWTVATWKRDSDENNNIISLLPDQNLTFVSLKCITVLSLKKKAGRNSCHGPVTLSSGSSLALDSSSLGVNVPFMLWQLVLFTFPCKEGDFWKSPGFAFHCVGVSLLCVSVGDLGLCQIAICWYMRAVSRVRGWLFAWWHYLMPGVSAGKSPMLDTFIN